MYEVSSSALQDSLRKLEKAFRSFFNGKTGHPKFKSRNNGIGSFTVYQSVKVLDQFITLPKIGRIRLKQKKYLPVGKKVTSATVSEKCGRWYVSVLVEEEVEKQPVKCEVIGIDLGIKTLATCSDGSTYENPKALRQLGYKIKRTQRRLSRKQKGSNRYRKEKLKLSKLHQRVANIRKDATHKATSEIVKTKQPRIIVLEDLNVQGMVKNRKLAKSIYDASLSEFRRQIEYKCKWYGPELRIANRFFPSSKMCSGCGNIKQDLKLKDRTYICTSCGLTLNRDLNASYNLANTVSYTGINAHGDGKVHAGLVPAGDHLRSEN